MSLPIKTAYMSFVDINQQTQIWKDAVLGGICFYESVPENYFFTAEMPIVQLQAPVLEGADIAMEIWLSRSDLSIGKPLKSGQQGAIQYRLNDELLFGVISLPEADSLQNATESAYRDIFALMEEMDFPHIYRFWNYMADINGISDGLERYRQFNVGRKDALFAYDDDLDRHLPAACALGLANGPLTIAFLLGRQAPIAIENPRQINAYDYPEEYGPRTPSFSRATLLRTEKNAILFISGTASIVGHLTQHPSDVVAQTKETLINLDAVVSEANRVMGEQKFDLKHIYFRVYLRHAKDLSLVRDEMERYLGGAIKALFVQADICRQELLLEIEATVGDMLEVESTKCL